MSNNKCVYYKEKEQKSIDGGITWVDTGNFRKGALITTQASQCGSFVTEYRWTKADYVCDNANKYKGYKQQVSYDNGGSWVDTGVVDIGELISSNSKDCGYDEQWFTLTGDKDFICDGAAKYKKKEMKYTRDSGTTWNSFDPQKYEKGDLIAETSSDCASMKVTYTDGTTKYFSNLTSIGEYTVSNKADAENVEIYDGVKKIGNFAFANCDSLTSISIPISVTNIGQYAFANCSSLTSVNIPDSVKTIDSYAFVGCSSLRTMTVNATTPPTLGKDAIPNNIQRIYVPADSVDKYKTADGWKDYADKIWAIGYDEQWFTLTGDGDKDFICSEGSKYQKKEMKYTRNSGTTWNSFYPPKYEKGDLIESNSSACPPPVMKVTYTDGSTKVFYDLTSIKSDTIPNKTNAKNVEIYDSVTSIGEGAFYECTSLTGVTIPDGVTSIGEMAFSYCSSLTGITIPDSVTSIGNYLFQACSSLTSITIPNSVTSIGEEAFSVCTSLTSITIPNSVKTIGIAAFRNCTSLTGVTIPNSVKTIGYMAFGDCDGLTSIIIPDGVTIIGDGTFSDCIQLTSVTIPNSVIIIGQGAFRNCRSLTGITIPDCVTSIGDVAFSDCRSLTGITIPDSVKTIGIAAFSICTSLTGITIPDSVTSIGYMAFYECRSLTTITVQPTTPPTLGSDAFATSGIQRIYVPASSVNAYKSADEWKNYASKIQAIP